MDKETFERLKGVDPKKRMVRYAPSTATPFQFGIKEQKRAVTMMTKQEIEMSNSREKKMRLKQQNAANVLKKRMESAGIGTKNETRTEDVPQPPQLRGQISPSK